jgi:hypothetical protein
MSTFPGSPRVLRGGLVLLDPGSGSVVRVIAMQYNPDSLSRTLQVQGVGETGDRSAVLRLKGPPVESYKLEAEIDIADQLESGSGLAVSLEFGLQPQLSALELVVYPSTAQLESTRRMADAGALEIAPVEAPMVLFVWSESRVVPVRITEFSITEEAFDPKLNPIRAKISLGMRVLNVNDFGFGHRGGDVFLRYVRRKESFAALNLGSLQTLGLTGAP